MYHLKLQHFEKFALRSIYWEFLSMNWRIIWKVYRFSFLSIPLLLVSHINKRRLRLRKATKKRKKEKKKGIKENYLLTIENIKIKYNIIKINWKFIYFLIILYLYRIIKISKIDFKITYKNNLLTWRLYLVCTKFKRNKIEMKNMKKEKMKENNK